MHGFNPVVAANAIDSDYKRYLKTTFNPRRAWFASLYAAALGEATETGELGGKLHLQPRRPYLEGKTIPELINEGILHSDMAGMLAHPLYEHQEEAVRLAASSNIVLATGTGSGKTEGFLLPIINDLLKERDAGTLEDDGVRAIIVYPMNALAADQMKRLNALLEPLKSITYGRFVGPTPHSQSEAERKWKAQPDAGELPTHELMSRDVMRKTPPHILVTNYAMLERLLLLPENYKFFTPSLKAIALDEVHVYDGAKGTEIAMLLRRLQSRSGKGSTAVRCYAASATLGDGSASSREEAAKFASDLFGAPFTSNGVILPSHSVAQPPLGTTDPEMLALYKEVNENRVVDASLPNWSKAVSALALNPQGHAVRFHQVIKSPGGAFCCLNPAHPSDKPRMRLQAGEICIACNGDGITSSLVELGTCRKCGWEYILGRIDSEKKLRLSDELGDEIEYFRILSLPIGVGPQNEEIGEAEEDAEGEGASKEIPSWICLECSSLNYDNFCSKGCLDSRSLLEVRQIKMKNRDDNIRCGNCQHMGTGFGPISRPSAGPDALSAVLATSLYQNLPSMPADGRGIDRPGGGRKLLAFSDSRQDAAYFAPYLSDTYGRLLRRSMIVEALRKLESSPAYQAPYGLNLIASELAQAIDSCDLKRGNEAASLAATWLRAEAISMDSYRSLSGTGLVRWEVPSSNLNNTINVLTSVGLSKDTALDTIQLLVQEVLAKGALECPTGVVASDPLFTPLKTVQSFYGEGASKNPSAHRWASDQKRGNRQGKILSSALSHLGAVSEDHRSILLEIFKALIQDGVLKQLPGKAGLLILGWDRLEAYPSEKTALGWACEECRRWSWWAPSGICATSGCLGLPKASDRALERDHYASLYVEMKPIPLSSKEHTAQWTAEEAEKVQNEFSQGKVTVLSCSTTFEMGVDLGDVSAVLCRNVPPTPANYVQRAGRAGRRSGSPSLVVTLARRRSHDAQYASEPSRLISGVVPIPRLSLENPELLRRHLYAVALSSFLRDSGLEEFKVGSFFAKAGGADAFLAWLWQEKASVLKEIDSLNLSSSSRDALQLPSDEWINLLTSTDSENSGAWLSRVAERVQADFDSIEKKLQELNNSKNDPNSKVKKSVLASIEALVTSVKEGLESKSPITLLANSGVLPKYGFPVDVVSLRVPIKDMVDGRGSYEKNSVIDLTRDLRLAIAEYFPGNEVVAGGSVIRSIALSKPPQSESGFYSLQWSFVTCDYCGWYTHARKLHTSHAIELPSKCGRCERALTSKRGTFVQPLHGFVAKRTDEVAGSARKPKRRGKTRTYLSDDATDSQGAWTSCAGGYEYLLSADAHLLTLSSEWTQLCYNCGDAGVSAPKKDKPRKALKENLKEVVEPHQDARKAAGSNCEGNKFYVRLGHESRSDVLQIKLKEYENILCACKEPDCQGALESVAAALVAGAVRVLGTTRSDLDAAVSSHATAMLMLFDTTPGGAGFARAAAAKLPEVIQAAISLLSQCECHPTSSCYACLRTYQNQWRHDHLSKNEALYVLKSMQ